MLTIAQIEHFRTFGFVILRDHLAETIAALRTEVGAALRHAFGATYDARVVGGIAGHYLPMASRYTPTSTSLICDDPRLIAVAEALLDGPVILECPEGNLYFGEAGWHADDGVGVQGVKFAVYFDELGAANGALRLMPGSHHPEQHARLTRYRNVTCRRERAGEATARELGFPGYVADTRPGDVICFDVHTWHASLGGHDRLVWTIVYQRCPESADERERAQRSFHDSYEQAPRGFDRDRYPIWRDWVAGAEHHPRRVPVIERMRSAGVLGLEGADLRW